ncbi:hypothetical protein [Acaryochloris sp. CCMEE 5410]|uniref:hypothetical protein n=1 Tax=Acaryochloris sp. CCMEE 5410 TaxID=310037 RepID=UPI0021D0B55A|nr:hypothetical protein [Acaryochloris sp. CCMEE 5410]KAI9130720.1 hypothetical protein ON05_023455 [Acaryochloris sp. CCMEE 5410]
MPIEIGPLVGAIEIGPLVGAIAKIAAPVAANKLQRNEVVIKLLTQFDLVPEHPPADFSGAYAYALVEYGVGKPPLMLELLRQDEICRIFRESFEHNNPNILLAEGERYVHDFALGDEIRARVVLRSS